MRKYKNSKKRQQADIERIPDLKRNITIFQANCEGVSYNQLAKIYDLSVARIGQIIKRMELLIDNGQVKI